MGVNNSIICERLQPALCSQPQQLTVELMGVSSKLIVGPLPEVAQELEDLVDYLFLQQSVISAQTVYFLIAIYYITNFYTKPEIDCLVQS